MSVDPSYIQHHGPIHEEILLQSSKSSDSILEQALPPELIDVILSTLDAEDSYYSLTQCLLVSRSFLALARRYIFAKISIRDLIPGPSSDIVAGGGTSETKQMDGLLQILQEDPFRDVHPLALHVRTLWVSMCPASNPMHTGPDKHKPTTWNAQRRSLHHILNMLPNLDTFGLEFTGSMSWNWIEFQMHDSLARVFESSSLTTLYLLNIRHFPAHLLGHCVHLRGLRLESVSSVNTIPPQRNSANWDAKSLQKLEIIDTKASGEIFREIMKAKADVLLEAPFSRLTHLTLRISHEVNFADEWEAMKCAATSLECLTVDEFKFSASYIAFPGPIHLSTLTSLRTLVLRVNIGLYQPTISVAGLASVLTRGLEPITIENLIITFLSNTPFSVRQERQLFLAGDPSTWPKIDDALSGPSFPSLESVHLTFRWRYDDEAPVYMHRRSGKEGLDKLRKGIAKERNEKLARVWAQAQAALPKVAHTQRIEYKTEFDIGGVRGMALLYPY